MSFSTTGLRIHRKVVLENGTPCCHRNHETRGQETFRSVSVDNFGGVYRSVEHLIRSGYRIAHRRFKSSLGGGETASGVTKPLFRTTGWK